MCFSKHKLAIEVDQKGHADRDEKKRKWKRGKNKNNLDFYILELLLMKKVMIFFLRLVK